MMMGDENDENENDDDDNDDGGGDDDDLALFPLLVPVRYIILYTGMVIHVYR
jgi:hypothetical protein